MIKEKDLNVLKIVEIPKFIDIKLLKKYVEKDINSNIDYFDEMKISYRISDFRKAEWIIYKSI